MSLLWLKLTLAPCLVAAVSIATRVFGARVGGFLAGLPIVAAPVLLLLTLEQGPAFGRQAAYGCAFGIFSLVLFCVAYAYASRRLRWPASVLVGWLVVALNTPLMRMLPQEPWCAALVPLLGITLSLKLVLVPDVQHVRATPPPWDLPLRMAATASLVVAITLLADLLGPALSGILSPFPIATSVLAAFAHAQLGQIGAIVLLRGLLFGLYSFVAFALAVGLLLSQVSTLAAFVGALAVCFTVQALMFLGMRAHAARALQRRLSAR